jgi:hypothetical protein
VLAAWNLILVITGGFIYANEYGYGLSKTVIGLLVLVVSLLLWAYRHKVQDRTPLRLREETPLVPSS